MARFDFAKCRRLVPAARQRVGTARVEMAARRRVDLARNVALEDHAFAIPRTVFPKAVPRSNQRRALLQNPHALCPVRILRIEQYPAVSRDRVGPCVCRIGHRGIQLFHPSDPSDRAR